MQGIQDFGLLKVPFFELFLSINGLLVCSCLSDATVV